MTYVTPCQNCHQPIVLDHVTNDLEIWVHALTYLGECDRENPFGDGATPPDLEE